MRFPAEEQSSQCYLHRGVMQGLVDRRNINTTEEVTIHVVGPTNVVYIGSVVEQVGWIIREEVSVYHCCEGHVVHDWV